MGFFDDIEADICQQEEQAKTIPVHDTVKPLHEIAPKEDGVVVNEVVAVELCVLSSTAHHRGWRYVLTDKEAATDFATAKEKLSTLRRDFKDAKIFRVTVWQPKKEQRDSQVRKPGSVFISSCVTNFSNYKGVMPQAETTYDAMIKTEPIPQPKRQKLE